MKPNKLVYGVGINDVDYCTQKSERYLDSDGNRKSRKIWICPYYAKWSEMLRRCYSEKFHDKQLTYKDAYVCDEWLYFSNFIKWVNTQPEKGWEYKELDKDFLSSNVKVYSPSTCVFINKLTNTFINNSKACRGKYKIGVSFVKNNKKNPFRAKCEDPFKRYGSHLGYYQTENEAHIAWKECKHKYSLEVVELETNVKVRTILKTLYLN